MWQHSLLPSGGAELFASVLRSELAFCCCFFFNDTATTEIYTLSLHDALPILLLVNLPFKKRFQLQRQNISLSILECVFLQDRKSTRLNSSHGYISYAVFCLKKKKTSSSGFCTRSPGSSIPGAGSHPVHLHNAT